MLCKITCAQTHTKLLALTLVINIDTLYLIGLKYYCHWIFLHDAKFQNVAQSIGWVINVAERVIHEHGRCWIYVQEEVR